MINGKPNNAEIREKASSKLEDKIAKVGGKLIPITEWDDNIADDIQEEGQLSTEIINGKVLQINGKREIAFAKFGKKTCMVCYCWIPLSTFEEYTECFTHKNDYFAAVLSDEDYAFFSRKLKGFQVGYSEGF